jgi:hypothetical protein
MSNATDKLVEQEVLDQYLRGASAYSQLYRSDAADDVPVDLDRNVLAEAATAVKQPKKFAWQRVTPMLAIAATAVLTVSIVMRSGLQTTAPVQSTEQIDELKAELKKEQSGAADAVEPIETKKMPPAEIAAEASAVGLPSVKLKESPAPAAPSVQLQLAKSEASAAEAKASKAREKDAAPIGEAPAQLGQVEVREYQRQSSVQDVPVAVSALTDEQLSRRANLGAGPRGTIPPAAAPASARADKAAAVTDLEEVVITGQKKTGPIAAGPRGTVPVADTRSRAEHNAEEQYRAGSPVAWLNYIRELREQGKTRTADSEWERFVKTYPNYPVDENDVARPKKTTR